MKHGLKLSLAALLLCGAAYAQDKGGIAPAGTPNLPPVATPPGGADTLKDKTGTPPGTGGDPNATMQQSLARIGVTTAVDKDSDGKITRAEAKLDRTLDSRFGTLDVNGDGTLTQEEIAASGGASAVGKGQFDFARLDADGDGSISKSEAKSGGISARFGKADTDKDGKLSKDELDSIGKK